VSPARKPPVEITPLAISDLTALAALGLTPRQFRRWLIDASVPHRKLGRRTIVLVDHVRAALGATAAPAPALSRVELVRLAAGGDR